ncbi:yrhK-like family protein [Lyngbya aestuarii BL J]|uniref:YrhK-like family protein n=1 Tax=Lyngbya aestuarii BL J TaxID=1348334 RepID=U7QQY3_9CYAN|nr:yrhK-like family protein [Lyngbya aestuarii BL J]
MINLITDVEWVKPTVKPLKQIIYKYRWIHTAIGILGNTCFVIGSILFLF